MHRKTVLLIEAGGQAAIRFARLVEPLDAELVLAPVNDYARYLEDVDLVVCAVASQGGVPFEDLEQAVYEAGDTSILFVVEPAMLSSLRLPTHIPADFALADASDDELAVRLRHLLWPGEESASSDFLTMGKLSINLSTYQVQVEGEPVDFTYLEYALLAYLVTHAGRVCSREQLLSRVWGFDYYGGSRTVDVHVRRVRSKLGNELAAHLDTVRGVGYIWNS